MAEFVQRTTAPDTSNGYYYANNPFYQSGYGLPNCTCYAYGRFWEVCGTKPSLSLGDAENWYGHSDGYTRGNSPKLGAVVCWRKGEVGVNSDGAGHVAIVEQINADGSIVTSESGWGASSTFWRTTRQNDGNWGMASTYTFQGFIYNPVNFDGNGETVTPVSGNRYLSQSEMETNARYIWSYLGARGWTKNAVAGMLGNMQTESTINPAIWQNLEADNMSGGFGLVQWTPASKYFVWCDENGLTPEKMDSNLKRIEYELENGLQYYPTDTYPETFAQFKTSTKNAEYLGMAFLANYERPANPDQPARGEQATAWYTFLQGLSNPDTSDTPSTPSTPVKNKGLPLWMVVAMTRRKIQ